MRCPKPQRGRRRHDLRVGHGSDVLQRLAVFTRGARGAAIARNDDLEMAHVGVVRRAENAAVRREAGRMMEDAPSSRNRRSSGV